MSIADEIAGILKQYQTGATPAPAAVNAHFDQVASAVPANVLADGLAHAMTSSQTPPLGQIVSALFNQANPAQKAAVLNQLMTVLGPAAVAAATGGALGAGARHDCLASTSAAGVSGHDHPTRGPRAGC